MSEAVMVGLAEVKISRASDSVLIGLGIGSCVSLCAYDPVAQVAGMARVVLPENDGSESGPGRFADTAVPFLLAQMTEAGAVLGRLRFALVGGAQLFARDGMTPRDLGARNIRAVEIALQTHCLYATAIDSGGSSSRTVHLFADGSVRVKTMGQGERELAQLGEGSWQTND